MQIIKPDYHNCGINVTSSILKHYGAQFSHATHPVVDQALEKGYRHIVFALFDGMGISLLERMLPASSFLRRHMRTSMTAVYPSTTTCATTSIESARCPAEHAWLGWTLYFHEIEKAVDVFTNRSEGEEAAEYDVASRYIPRTSVMDALAAVPDLKTYCISNFTDDVYVETEDELFAAIQAYCQKDEKSYIYVYWNEPDHTMHGRGCYHEDVKTILQNINRKMEALRAQLDEDTLIMITADHGLVDAKHHYLDDHPRIAQMLEHRPTIEARAASFHVRKECLEAFPKVFREEYGEHFLLLDRESFINEYLGEGKVHPKVYAFVGDYMALATDQDCIDGYRSDFELKGVHAGLTADEMLVPLIIA